MKMPGTAASAAIQDEPPQRMRRLLIRVVHGRSLTTFELSLSKASTYGAGGLSTKARQAVEAVFDESRAHVFNSVERGAPFPFSRYGVHRSLRARLSFRNLNAFIPTMCTHDLNKHFRQASARWRELVAKEVQREISPIAKPMVDAVIAEFVSESAQDSDVAAITKAACECIDLALAKHETYFPFGPDKSSVVRRALAIAFVCWWSGTHPPSLTYGRAEFRFDSHWNLLRTTCSEAVAQGVASFVSGEYSQNQMDRLSAEIRQAGKLAWQQAVAELGDIRTAFSGSEVEQG